MAADTTDGQSVSEQSEQKTVTSEVDAAPVETEELSRWVLDTLLRGENPEQVAHFVAQLRLKDEAYEALELHLQESLHRHRFPATACAKEQQAFFEFGKPPPLPKEMPLQRLRRNLSELDAIMARLVAAAPAHAPQSPATAPNLQSTSLGHSRAPVAVVGTGSANATTQERRATVPNVPGSRSLLLPCVQHGVMPRPSDQRMATAIPWIHPSGCYAGTTAKGSEDVLGRQINDFIKARLGSHTARTQAPLLGPSVAPSGALLRTVSPVRQSGPGVPVASVNGAYPAYPYRGPSCGKQVPLGTLVPTLVTRPPGRGRSAEPAPCRGRCGALAPEPRTVLAHQPCLACGGPSAPSRALSATMLTRGGGPVIVVTSPPVRRTGTEAGTAFPVRQPSPVKGSSGR